MNKIKETNKLRYGYENPAQSKPVREKMRKSGYMIKLFITPNGSMWQLQGYEPLIASRLIEEYGEEEIIWRPRDIPSIEWKNSDGKTKVYTGDFYVKNKCLIIEVKSKWTLSLAGEKLDIVQRTCNAMGYNYRLIVLDKKGTILQDQFFAL